MKVKDIMTKGVITVADELSVKEAACVLAEYDISGIIVVNEKNEFSGILSEMDITRFFGKDLENIRISEIMTKPIITIGKEEDVEKAARVMVENNIHRLLVIDEEKKEKTRLFSSGIISCGDIVKAIAGRK
ncbi:MAG: CBS domain-containing protein [bacterium]